MQVPTFMNARTRTLLVQWNFLISQACPEANMSKLRSSHQHRTCVGHSLVKQQTSDDHQ